MVSADAVEVRLRQDGARRAQSRSAYLMARLLQEDRAFAGAAATFHQILDAGLRAMASARKVSTSSRPSAHRLPRVPSPLAKPATSSARPHVARSIESRIAWTCPAVESLARATDTSEESNSSFVALYRLKTRASR
jgi:hypothetical protein